MANFSQEEIKSKGKSLAQKLMDVLEEQDESGIDVRVLGYATGFMLGCYLHDVKPEVKKTLAKFYVEALCTASDIDMHIEEGRKQ